MAGIRLPMEQDIHFITTSRSKFCSGLSPNNAYHRCDGAELVNGHCFQFVSGVKNAWRCTSTLRLRIHGLVLGHNSDLPLCYEICEVNSVCPKILETFRCPLWVAERNIDQCHRGGSLICHTGTTPMSHPRSTARSYHSAAYVYTAFAFPPLRRSFEGLLTDDIRTNHVIEVYTWINS
jgi:hypothetical protein